MNCRLCGADRLHSVLDLGATPPCELFLTEEALEEIAWVRRSGSRVRDMGHVFHVESFVVPHAGHTADIDDLEHAAQVARDLDWKVDDVVIVPVRQIPETFTR